LRESSEHHHNTIWGRVLKSKLNIFWNLNRHCEIIWWVMLEDLFFDIGICANVIVLCLVLSNCIKQRSQPSSQVCDILLISCFVCGGWIVGVLTTSLQKGNTLVASIFIGFFETFLWWNWSDSFRVSVISYYLAINLATLFVFWIDKRLSAGKYWRISEKTLMIFCVSGGYLGGIWAMSRFHHKSSKRSFLGWFFWACWCQYLCLFPSSVVYW